MSSRRFPKPHRHSELVSTIYGSTSNPHTVKAQEGKSTSDQLQDHQCLIKLNCSYTYECDNGQVVFPDQGQA